MRASLAVESSLKGEALCWLLRKLVWSFQEAELL